jgi:hypothetical protein
MGFEWKCLHHGALPFMLFVKILVHGKYSRDKPLRPKKPKLIGKIGSGLKMLWYIHPYNE